ncbi:MAG: PQQ-binding-like beta-propeller repeat protein [Bacteroidales bacterium]
MLLTGPTEFSHSYKKLRLILGAIIMFFVSVHAQENNSGDWTFFRGTGLDGVSANTGLPLRWGEDTNVVWKTTIHDLGHSSPVVLDNQVWLTTALKDGKELFALCLDFQTGAVIHNILVFKPDSVPGIHSLNSYATPTPALEKGFVYVHFGSMGTACLNTQTGKIVWTRTDLFCDHVQGPASCPILYKDLLIFNLEGIDVQYVIALDKRTGATVWQTERPKEHYVNEPPIARKGYSTPRVIQVNGKDLLISVGSEVCIAYDPLTGQEIWRVAYSSDSAIAMPLFSDGLVIFSTGFYANPVRLIAVKPDGTGNVTKSHVVWESGEDVPGINTPVVNKGILYMIQEKGLLTCLSAAKGEVIYKKRLKGDFYASPIIADGKVFFPSKQGIIYVLREGPVFEILAMNKLDGECWASIGISGKSILLRTNKALYRIMEK